MSRETGQVEVTMIERNWWLIYLSNEFARKETLRKVEKEPTYVLAKESIY